MQKMQALLSDEARLCSDFIKLFQVFLTVHQVFLEFPRIICVCTIFPFDKILCLTVILMLV
ncbi:hypothetical protein I7I48_10825 [Histoplasma ohiense]|nr:hypothetical protein I7I48_10825 [Histoplasma ohiense (nom. inval.)]